MVEVRKGDAEEPDQRAPLVGSPVIEKYYDKRAITKKVDGAGAAQEAREVTSHGTAEGVDHEFTIPYYMEIEERGATNVGLSEATLNGEVQPVGVEAKYYFEYGTTEAYGSRTSEASAGSGNAFVEVSAALSGLQLGTI